MHTWSVKVGDLLANPGSTDEISFSERYIEYISTICSPGVQGKIYIQSLTKQSVQVTLYDIVCTINETSDITGNTFIRPVCIEEYNALYAFSDHAEEWVGGQEGFLDVYHINPKDSSIDMGECIANAIRNEEPIIKIAPHENLLVGGENDENNSSI